MPVHPLLLHLRRHRPKAVRPDPGRPDVWTIWYMAHMIYPRGRPKTVMIHWKIFGIFVVPPKLGGWVFQSLSCGSRSCSGGSSSPAKGRRVKCWGSAQLRRATAPSDAKKSGTPLPLKRVPTLLLQVGDHFLPQNSIPSLFSPTPRNSLDSPSQTKV